MSPSVSEARSPAGDLSPPTAGRRVEAPLLAVEGLCIDFATDNGWVRVVEDVTFEVGRSETVGLVGESGSGKTVTSLAIMGLIPTPPGRVSAGRVDLDGVELSALGDRQLEDVRGDDVAMVFQEPMTSLNPAFTVGDQIAETVRRHRRSGRRAAKARAVEVLDAVGIPNAAARARSYPHELSGGMRQRAMIAMALSCEPKLLIADEPTTALDVTIQAQVLDLFRSLGDELGLSVLFVTHDLGVVADICDRVVVMYAGQVVEEAQVDDLYAQPRHPYASGLLRAMPQLGERGERLEVIPGRTPLPWAMPDGCRFHPRCAHADERCRTGEVALRDLGGQRSCRCVRVDELDLRAAPVDEPAGSAT